MGNIKMVPEGMDTYNIDEKERDNAVRCFFIMKNTAEKEKDTFYAHKSFYDHTFSYGNFFSDFIYQSWENIQKIPSLKGIEESTIEYILSSSQNFPKEISDTDFCLLEDPKATAGFKQPTRPSSEFIFDKDSWQKWNREWFTNNQENIDWSHATNMLFPKPAIIEEIIREELLKHKIDPKEDIIHQFHDKVMKHKGKELIAYATLIGTQICKSNFYVYEEELSKKEQKACSSLRKIFSIVNSKKKKQYISIDFAHGMFEFLDEHGNHQGEYRFDGSFNSHPEKDHSFRTLKL